MTGTPIDAGHLCDGRICVVTGGGRGIGREYARMLAAHGAHVVVNDLGGDRTGTGADAGPAQQVVDEITAAGGAAVANTDDISTWDGAQSLVGRRSRSSAGSTSWSTTPESCATGCWST